MNLRTAEPIRPFLDWRVVNDPEQWGGRVALIGVPFSERYAGEPSPNDQASAPDAIRLQTPQFWDGPERFDFDLGAPLADLLPERGIDAGNCFRTGDFEADFANTVARLKRLFSTTKLVCVLGGDHGATIPVLHGLEAVGRPVHVVQIDAHLDWRDEVGGVRRGYSSPLRRASELPFVSDITQIGLRGTGSARAGEVADARAWGARLVTAEEVHRDGIAPILAHLDGKGPFYLTIDADGLDPSAMPAVLGPVPGGLFAHQVNQIVRFLAGSGSLVGIDVVEVAPSFDPANRITAITAGRIMVNAIGHALKAKG
jgi:agmatinase